MHLAKLIVLAAITTAAACGSDPVDTPSAPVDALGPGEIAFINGKRVPESIFRLFTLNTLQADVDDLTPEGRAQVIDRLLYLSLMAQEAERKGLGQEQGIAAELELQRMQTLARQMEDRFAEENSPRESELRDLYEANLSQLLAPRYKTRHILVATEAEAADLIAQLDAGGDFIQLARENSIGPTAPEGGDLGWISSDSVVEPFAAAIQAATPGRHIDIPIETTYGWHVILVEEKEEQAAPGLASVRDDLMIALEAQKLAEFAASLREAAEISVVE